MIVGNICKGVKKMVMFKDSGNLSELQQILLCRLSTADEKTGKNMIKTIEEIDRILN